MSKRVSNKKGEHKGARCFNPTVRYGVQRAIASAPAVPSESRPIERHPGWVQRQVNKVKQFMRRHQSR